MNQCTRYVLLSMFLVLVMAGAMFAQGTNAPQGTPATKFGLPAAKPATGAVAPFPATTTTATTTASSSAANAKTAATSASVSTNVPTALKVSAAAVVFTQQGASTATTMPCSKFVLNVANASVAGGVGVGKTTWVVTFTKPWDNAPDPFVTAVVNGAHFDSVSFAFLGPGGGQAVSGVTLTSVFVGSVNKYFDAATGAAMEEISLVPKAINWGKSSPGPAGATFTDAWSATN